MRLTTSVLGSSLSPVPRKLMGSHEATQLAWPSYITMSTFLWFHPFRLRLFPIWIYNVSLNSFSFTMDSSRICCRIYLSEHQQVAIYVWIIVCSSETCQSTHIQAIHAKHHHRLFSVYFLDLEDSFLECRPKEISRPTPVIMITFKHK